MNLRIPLARVPLSPGAAARRWSTATLTRSRRNAMVALTTLAARRAERDDADAFLAEAVRRHAGVLPAPRRALHGS